MATVPRCQLQENEERMINSMNHYTLYSKYYDIKIGKKRPVSTNTCGDTRLS